MVAVLSNHRIEKLVQLIAPAIGAVFGGQRPRALPKIKLHRIEKFVRLIPPAIGTVFSEVTGHGYCLN
jgi:hypothetical protein